MEERQALLTRPPNAFLNLSGVEPRRHPWSFSERVLRIASLRHLLWFNLFVYVFSYAFSTVGMGALASVQTSIHYQDGLGATTMAVITITSMLTCFVIQPIHQKSGSRCLLVLSCVFYSLFCLANLYPTWPMMMTAAVVSGFGMSFGTVILRLVTAQLAHGYCRTQGLLDQQDRVQSRMFMVNIVVYKALLAVLFPLTSLMLSTDDGSGPEDGSLPDGNATLRCGASYCNEGFAALSLNRTSASDEVSNDSVANFRDVGKLVLFGVVCNVVAVLLLLLVDSMENLGIFEHQQTPKHHKTFSCGVMANPKMLLLIPAFLTSMACDMFWTNDFTAAFVTCSLGLESVGLVLMWTGVSGAVSSVLFGSFNSERFRKVPIIMSVLVPLAVLVALLSWSMTSNVFLVLCLLSALWYVASGVRLNLFPALLAVVFPDHLQSVYTVQHMWMSLGATLVAAWSNWLCMDVKMYILIVALLLSLLGYVTLEITLSVEKRGAQSEERKPTKINGGNYRDCFSPLRNAFVNS